MARSRGRWLVRLSYLSIVAAAGAWLLGYLQSAGNVPPGEPYVWLAERAPLLTVTAAVVVLVALVFRGLEFRLRRRDASESLRPLGRIENGVAVMIVVAFFFTVFVDVRSALLGLGLVGFGLTLALQRPLLAIAGWVHVTFNRPFIEGDRIEVDGIVGDVLDIGFLSTRMWEISSDKSGLQGSVNVAAGRATGRTLTISNAVFLEEPVANATSDISFIFDEFAVTVAYEADRDLAERLLRDVANDVLDPDTHAQAARDYSRLTRDLKMERHFPRQPTILESLQNDWVELRLRYLVPVRERSAIRKELAEAWLERSNQHADRLPNVYPRSQVMRIGRGGRGLEQ